MVKTDLFLPMELARELIPRMLRCKYLEKIAIKVWIKARSRSPVLNVRPHYTVLFHWGLDCASE